MLMERKEVMEGGPEMASGEAFELTAGRIGALVRLLADDNERIRRIAQENLAAGGPRALEIVRDSARKSEDRQVRAAAHRFLREARREEALARWSSYAKDGSLDLESGAFLIALTEYPDLDPAPFKKALDDYAEVLKKRLAAIRSSEAVVDRINALLFKELGFRGNRKDYYNPKNSYLNMVIERKLGIPISLCAVYLLVARRLGQKIEGVGMPGHFLLRYRTGRHACFLDPFDQGRRWTHQDCMAHLVSEGYGFREEYLRAVDDRDVLARMLANLLGIYHSREDQSRCERITRMFEAIQKKGISDVESR
jgi:regulator of sirC expression with transglutaminase-like and TPR domain